VTSESVDVRTLIAQPTSALNISLIGIMRSTEFDNDHAQWISVDVKVEKVFTKKYQVSGLYL
jgi:hypothetical protein